MPWNHPKRPTNTLSSGGKNSLKPLAKIYQNSSICQDTIQVAIWWCYMQAISLRELKACSWCHQYVKIRLVRVGYTIRTASESLARRILIFPAQMWILWSKSMPKTSTPWMTRKIFLNFLERRYTRIYSAQYARKDISLMKWSKLRLVTYHSWKSDVVVRMLYLWAHSSGINSSRSLFTPLRWCCRTLTSQLPSAMALEIFGDPLKAQIPSSRTIASTRVADLRSSSWRTQALWASLTTPISWPTTWSVSSMELSLTPSILSRAKSLSTTLVQICNETHSSLILLQIISIIHTYLNNFIFI